MAIISRTTEYRAYSFTYYYLGKVCFGLRICVAVLLDCINLRMGPAA
jgi:hypothetical protein